MVESLHGTFTLDEERGLGTTVTLSLPMRRALQKALLVVAGGVTWGLPEAAVIGSMEMDDADLDHQDGTATLERDGEMVPFAVAAATALLRHSKMNAREIAQEAMLIARKICIYPNDKITYEELG